MIRPVLAAAVVSVGAFVLGPSAQDQAPRVFRSGVDSVGLSVAVTTGNKPVTGLGPDDFIVTDNGVRQQVTSVSDERVPIDLTIVLDTSESITNALAAKMTDAVNRTREKLRAGDRVSVVTFNQAIRERVPLGEPSALLEVPLGERVGPTALNDAMAAVLTVDAVPDRRQMAIVYTDGADCLSFLDDDQIEAIAGRSQTALFMVWKGFAPRVPPLYEHLAGITGGVVQVIMDGGTGQSTDTPTVHHTTDMLDATFLRALEAFRTSYVVHYTLTGVSKAGWHTVSVKIAKPGRYQVRTRRGYQGGADE